MPRGIAFIGLEILSDCEVLCKFEKRALYESIS